MTAINETLRIEGGAIHCRCGQQLGPATENYKLQTVVREGPVQNAGPWVDPHQLGKDLFVCREYFCPGCATLLDVEIALHGEPILWDVRLKTE
jgi:acetone carboxylase gamma subunit